jgi:hypothetical protein
MNFAPTMGFEVDVGSRTSVYVLNSHNSRRMATAAKTAAATKAPKSIGTPIQPVRRDGSGGSAAAGRRGGAASKKASGSPQHQRHRGKSGGSGSGGGGSAGRRLDGTLAPTRGEGPLLTKLCRTATSVLFFGDEWISTDDEASTMRKINQQQTCGGAPTDAFPQRALKLRKQAGAWSGAMVRAYDTTPPTVNLSLATPMERAAKHALPSAGWYAVLSALAHCRRVTLYGFELTSGAAAPAPHYYYEEAGSKLSLHNSREMSASHNADKEKLLYRRLTSSRLGRVRVCHERVLPLSSRGMMSE